MPPDTAPYLALPFTENRALLRGQNSSDEYNYRNRIPAYANQTPAQVLSIRHLEREKHKGRREGDFQALKRMQLASTSDFLPHIGAPIGSQELIGYWLRLGLRGAVPVPIGCPHGQPVWGFSSVVVDFVDMESRGPSRGIPLGSVLTDDPLVMEDPDEKVLDKFRVLGPLKDLKLELTIAWPGYNTRKFPIRMSTLNQELTRWDLAMQITMAYTVFFKRVEAEGRLSGKNEFFHMSLQQGKKAREDSLGIQFSQLHLVRFRNTVGGFWVSEIEIV